jgi:hypothetical protein
VLDGQLVSVELAKQLVLGLASQPSQRSTSPGAAGSSAEARAHLKLPGRGSRQR